MGVLKD
jgi:hypothetical protein